MERIIKLLSDISKFLLRFFTAFLIILSAFIIIVASLKAFSHPIEISPDGIQLFLSFYKAYYEVFAATFVLIGILLVLEQVEIGATANKITNRINWKNRLDEKIKSLEKNNAAITYHLDINAENIYDFLYPTNNKIRDYAHLNDFFTEFLNDNIKRFEEASIDCPINKSLRYKNETSYSLFQVNSIIEYILIPAPNYPSNFKEDFGKLYIEQVNKIQHQLIQ
jgi:hypothetical protein